MSVGKSAPTTTGTNSGTSTLSLPSWYTNEWQNILGLGNNLYSNLATPVAGLMPDQVAASWLTNAALQNFMTRPQVPSYDVFGMGNQWDTGAPMEASLAAPIAVNGAGFNNLPVQQANASLANAARANAAQLRPGQIAPFMNPYIDTALNPVLNRLRQQQAETQADIGAKAAAAHMFGGSREAVERMLADRNYKDTLANTAGNMLLQGYQNAAGLAGQNAGWRQQTNLTNAQMQNAINQLNAQLGTNVSLQNAAQQNQMTGLGAQLANQLGIAGLQAGTQVNLANAAAQNAIKQQYQNLLFQGSQADADRFLRAVAQQNGIDVQTLQAILNGTGALSNLGAQQQGTAQNALNAYWQQLNQLANLLRIGTPGGTTTSSGTTTSTTQRPRDIGSILVGGLGLLGGLSDREDKTDVKKLGKDPESGVDMYAYRYKGDPKSYPKVVGPMAQDLERVMPGITKMIGEHMTVSPMAQMLDRLKTMPPGPR